MLFEEVLRDLEADCWAAFSPLFMNRSNNRLSDVLFNPDRTLAEVQANAFSIYYMLRFEAALHIDTQGYEALEKIHERLPEHLLKAYEQLDLLMDQNATIQEHIGATKMWCTPTWNTTFKTTHGGTKERMQGCRTQRHWLG